MCGKLRDLTDETFGRLTVIRRNGSDKHGRPMWLCRCECGTVKSINSQSLTNGYTTSCGCLRVETARNAHFTHGQSKTKLYGRWCGIKQRCYDPDVSTYKHYGGRGIRMCDSWKDDFKNFYDDVSSLPHFNEPGYSLDRIDNNGYYELSNVRWADRSTQMNNTEINRNLTYNGETLTVAEWARIINVPYNTLFSRLKRGWTVEKALTAPIRPQRRFNLD